MPASRRSQNKVILIGLGLILLVAFFTFLRPSLKKEKVVEIKDTKTYTTIDANDLQEKIRINESIRVLDSRDSGAYNQTHIIDSINVNSENITEISSIFLKDDLIVIVGTGRTDDIISRDIFDYFKDKGFSDVFILAGGMSSWINSNNATISWGNPDSIIDRSKVDFIEPEELKKLIESNSATYILDVRSDEFFSESHISGSDNIPIDSIEKNRKKIPIVSEIIVYGNTELEGFQAGVKLFDLGYPLVKVLTGGFLTWKDNQFPIVTE